MLAQLASIELGRHLLVEAVPDDTLAARVEVEYGVAADFGHLRALVDDARVGNVGVSQTDLARDAVGYQGAQVAGVLTLNTVVALLLHQVVDLIGAALAGTGQTAAAHNDGYLVSAYAVTFQHIQYGTLAVVELVCNFLEFLNLLDGVAQVFGKDFGLSFINGGFG